MGKQLNKGASFMKKYPYHTVGAKYHEVENLDIKEIARLVRKDLKTLFEGWPHANISVRIKKYSMGRSISAYVSGLGVERNSNNARSIQRQMRLVVDKYNFDDSDSMTDYHHTSFDTYVKVES